MMDRPRKPKQATEFVKYGFFDASERIEAIHARFDRHAFSTHAHDTWAIGAVVSGAKDISAKGSPHCVISAAEVYALPPHRAHAGKTVGSSCEYVMLYVPDQEWKRQCGTYGVSTERFSSGALQDPRSTQLLVSFVNLMLDHAEMLASWSGEWVNFCESLLRPYSDDEHATVSPTIVRADPDLLRAYDYLREYWNHNVSLGDLARESAMSVHEVCRRFSAVYGLSPHRYQLVLRLMKAKTKLLQGSSISDVATDSGFADQSHLGRHFKSVFGMTPGTVLKEAEADRAARSPRKHPRLQEAV